MSVVGNNRVGIPIVVLHDAEGAVVEIETKTGELIRGLLFEAEDQMNLYIKNAIIRDIHGVKRKSPQVYVRGTEIVFIILPDMLKHAPMFNRIKHWRKHGGAPPEGVGQAVGQAAAIIRKAEDDEEGDLADVLVAGVAETEVVEDEEALVVEVLDVAGLAAEVVRHNDPLVHPRASTDHDEEVRVMRTRECNFVIGKRETIIATLHGVPFLHYFQK
eukprot:CAMPEP_0116141780 /NCGR_PEP_ID=MMETSP0329-20121206/14559_1 /TAXON_ID=697910 /ORGANISM="Pseudo-nitzschia arenysensis, Strain B593" /LENGTH=215 /DNA_ID=CAMNT_0003636975 /DNA_START=149 /DNA_END=797 /DNA_ORIENTATION=+